MKIRTKFGEKMQHSHPWSKNRKWKLIHVTPMSSV